MRYLLFLCFVLPFVSSVMGAPVSTEERLEQAEAFEIWWNTKLEWEFDKLPSKGGVAEFRIPYSGHDYPDRAGELKFGSINNGAERTSLCRRHDHV